MGWVARDLQQHWHVIAPDLRGHGDSDWASDGTYTMASYIYDLAELIDSIGARTVTLIGHSLGGNICLRYAGLFPHHVAKLVLAEGIGLPHDSDYQRSRQAAIDVRLRLWIAERRQVARRQPRRYLTLRDAVSRMQAENPFLTAEQATHLTAWGSRRQEDGSRVWKFDPALRALPPSDGTDEEMMELMQRISAPSLLLFGSASAMSDPADARIQAIQGATVEIIEGAGHWMYHDRLAAFLDAVHDFLG